MGKTGQLIKEKREALGWTQAELAKKLGMTKQAVWDMERRDNIGAAVLKRLNVPDIFGAGYFPLKIIQREVFDFEAFESKAH